MYTLHGTFVWYGSKKLCLFEKSMKAIAAKSLPDQKVDLIFLAVSAIFYVAAFRCYKYLPKER